MIFVPCLVKRLLTERPVKLNRVRANLYLLHEYTAVDGGKCRYDMYSEMNIGDSNMGQRLSQYVVSKFLPSLLERVDGHILRKS